MIIASNNSLIKTFVESGKYNITQDGHIYNIRTGKEIGYTSKDTGYKVITIGSREKTRRIFIHRIIWYVYGDTPLSDTLVLNHKDGNKLNNCIDNLEQVTQAQNNLHKFRVLNHAPVIGHNKLTKKQANEIRLLRAQGWKYRDLIKKFKVCKSTISYVVNKKTWK